MSDEIYRDMRDQNKRAERKAMKPMFVQPKKNVRVSDVYNCAGCNGDHYNLLFHELETPTVEGYTYKSECPSTHRATIFMKDMPDKLYAVFTVAKGLEIQKCDDTAPEDYTDDNAAVDFVRDLELGDPYALTIARAFLNSHK